MRQGTVPLIFHWFSLFDIDPTEKLRVHVHCQTERWEVYLCMCVLKCTVPALFLFCDTQSECGSNDEE